MDEVDDSRVESPGERTSEKYDVDSTKVTSALVKYRRRTGL